ncbi:MAG: OmpA family protein [Elusimicrobia bacterium]|nr:OmpA family protein [Elusimicrobiota bacterium]
MNRLPILLAAVLLAAACAPRGAVKTGAAGAAGPGGAEGEAPTLAYTKSEDMPEADIRSGHYSALPELATVHFEYDQYGLTPSAVETLRRNSDWLRHNPGVTVLVEGHADEKGTVEYNLALGQKRAKTVREYYIRAGVDPGLIGTISYGKEKPECVGKPYEVCGPINRRAVTLAASKK